MLLLMTESSRKYDLDGIIQHFFALVCTLRQRFETSCLLGNAGSGLGHSEKKFQEANIGCIIGHISTVGTCRLVPL